MLKKIELLEELRKLDEQIQAIRDKEGPTPEDVKELNGLCDQVEEIDALLKVEERAAEVNERNRKPAETPGSETEPRAEERQEFKSLGEQLIAVARASQPGATPDRRLFYEQAETRAATGLSSQPSEGGFLIQTDFASGVMKKTYETSVVFNRANNIPISSNANGLKINFVDETSRATGSRWGGVQAYWLEEAGTKTASKPKFGQMQLSLKKLVALYYATDEVLQDAAALGSIASQAFSEEIGFLLDDSLINGSGAGQPAGILNAACLVTVAKEGGQVARTVIWDNIQKMYAQFWSRSLSRGVWFINQSVLTQLMSMTIPVGTGGIPVWLPANLAQGRPNQTLMGMPVIPIEQCATLGTVGDVILADMSQYVVITKGGLQSAQSIHVRFINDESVFRFVFRVDGQATWSSSLTPFKDASTSLPLGPFVALATRS